MFLVSMAVCVAVVAFYLLGHLQELEFASVDLRFKLRGGEKPHPDVAVVTVDEKSISDLGRWPWPRSRHARLIGRLAAAGAKAVAFDVLFTEPDKDRPEGDADLGLAASRAGNVVFGMVFRTKDGAPAQPLRPIPPLQKPGVFQGYVNVFPETDGVVRKLPVWVDYQGEEFPSLSLAALAAGRGTSAAALTKEFPLAYEGLWNEINLNFSGGYQTFPYYSFSDVYRGLIPQEAFKGKYVFVGGTAFGLFDFKPVPNVPLFPGLEIHATAMDNYLKLSALRTVDFFWTLCLVLIIGALLGVMVPRLSIWRGAVLVLSIFIAYAGACQWFFVKRLLILDFCPPMLTVLFSYGALLFYSYWTEGREKKWIKGTFSQYLSPQVVEVLMADPSRLRLGGEEREMTVFFSDLAGFTSIAETLKPADLVSVLNEYLTEMSSIIFKYAGVVDKYIGDAIMAFWNAPVDQPSHAAFACHAALEQIEKLNGLQKKFSTRGLPLIDCRIGINTGPMVVGNMGSKSRFNYTVVGDAVNLASRLEAANKIFNTRVMISEFTYEKVKGDFEARPLDLLRVKGKAKPVGVYELAARKGELSPAQKEAFAAYAEGLGHYRSGKFNEALEKFQLAGGRLPGDGPSQAYAERSAAYLREPPPEGWDGVFTMSTK